jgi:hypothetical protein
MAFPLQALTGKRTYQWGDEQEKVFDELRNAMVRAPVLAELSPFLYWSYLPFCGVISLFYIGVIL